MADVKGRRINMNTDHPIRLTPNQAWAGIFGTLVAAAIFTCIQFFWIRDLVNAFVAHDDVVQFSIFSLFAVGLIPHLLTSPYLLYVKFVKGKTLNPVWIKLIYSFIGLIVVSWLASFLIAMWMPSHLKKHDYTFCKSMTEEAFMYSKVWTQESVICEPYIPGPFGNNMSEERDT